jgi:predicted nucleotidyltransferase
MPPNPKSLRLAAVLARGEELLAVAQELRADGIALCGSVARGIDTDLNPRTGKPSDIDFYVRSFRDPTSTDARDRADLLVKRYRELLGPHRVDIRPLPGWLLDPPFEATMKRDAVDLRHLLGSQGAG